MQLVLWMAIDPLSRYVDRVSSSSCPQRKILDDFKFGASVTTSAHLSLHAVGSPSQCFTMHAWKQCATLQGREEFMHISSHHFMELCKLKNWLLFSADEEPVLLQSGGNTRIRLLGPSNSILFLSPTNIFLAAERADGGDYTCTVCTNTGPEFQQRCLSRSTTLFLIGSGPKLEESSGKEPR